MAVEKLLLMSAKKGPAITRASKRGRRKGDNSLFSGVLQHLGTGGSTTEQRSTHETVTNGDSKPEEGLGQESDALNNNSETLLMSLPNVLGSPNAQSAHGTKTPEKDPGGSRETTPPVYMPDEQFTTSSIGTFQNMDTSPFLQSLNDGDDSRPGTRVALFGSGKANGDDMEAASALKSLGTPLETKKGVKRKSLFATVIGNSSN